MPSAVNQPKKSCPALVGVGKLPTIAPSCLVAVLGVTVPPLALKVIVKFCTFHLAVKVSFLVIRVVVVSLVPAVLNQPAKVYPVLVGLVGSVPKVESNCRIAFAGVGEPPAALNETVKDCIAHLAVNVALPLTRRVAST